MDFDTWIHLLEALIIVVTGFVVWQVSKKRPRGNSRWEGVSDET